MQLKNNCDTREQGSVTHNTTLVINLPVPPFLVEVISVAAESVGGRRCQLGNEGILLLLLLLLLLFPRWASAACQVR